MSAPERDSPAPPSNLVDQVYEVDVAEELIRSESKHLLVIAVVGAAIGLLFDYGVTLAGMAIAVLAWALLRYHSRGIALLILATAIFILGMGVAAAISHIVNRKFFAAIDACFLPVFWIYFSWRAFMATLFYHRWLNDGA